jgi:hypothetical protein
MSSSPLFCYIKNKKDDKCGVAPLKRNGLTFSDSTTKANILNSQFSSVFTSEDLSNMPDMGVSSTPEIPPIIIHHNGVMKLLTSFLDTGATIAVFQSDGILLWLMDAWNINVSAGVISLAVSFSRRPRILSDPRRYLTGLL